MTKTGSPPPIWMVQNAGSPGSGVGQVGPVGGVVDVGVGRSSGRTEIPVGVPERISLLVSASYSKKDARSAGSLSITVRRRSVSEPATEGWPSFHEPPFWSMYSATRADAASYRTSALVRPDGRVTDETRLTGVLASAWCATSSGSVRGCE